MEWNSDNFSKYRYTQTLKLTFLAEVTNIIIVKLHLSNMISSRRGVKELNLLLHGMTLPEESFKIQQQSKFYSGLSLKVEFSFVTL